MYPRYIRDAIKLLAKTRHMQTDTLLALAMLKGRKGLRKNILINGPAGGGKSTATKQIADALGIPYYYTGQVMLASRIEGYLDPHTGKWRKTEFIRAFMYGGVFVAEEFDGWGPNPSLAFNTALANGYITNPETGELVERHPDCIVFACGNTWGTGATTEYVGRNKMDAATLDRFIKVYWDYDTDLEASACGDPDVAAFVQQCRENAKKAGIKVMITPRASIDIADMLDGGFSMQEACQMTFLSALDADQRRTVLHQTEDLVEMLTDQDLPFKGLMHRA